MDRYPLIVVGAGAGGLVVAIGATKAGKRALLVERGNWGGDCTNFGCIPSKSLIASAQMGDQDAFTRLRSVISRVRKEEEPAALREKGVETIEGHASFVDPHTLEIEGYGQVWGKEIVLATGSSPRIPDIPGIHEADPLTNETLFSLEEIPKSLIIFGGGPIGCELGQALSRLGCRVSLIHRHKRLLMREEPESQQVVADQLTKEGVELYLGWEPTKVLAEGEVEIRQDEAVRTISAERILIAAGRVATLDGLHLERAKVRFSDRGIESDRFGRTCQRHIFVVGDAGGPPFFTHRAENQGRAVLLSLLLPSILKKRISKQPIPRVTYTDPEIAGIGMSEKEAIQKMGERKVATYLVPMEQVDRALATGRTEGFVKITTKRWSSRILGASLVGPGAGDLLPQISMMIEQSVPLRKAASLIYPYPTYSQAIRKAADLWLTQTVLKKKR